jgi:hypothetical protein
MRKELAPHICLSFEKVRCAGYDSTEIDGAAIMDSPQGKNDYLMF